MQIAGKSTFKHSGESLFIGMYKYEELKGISQENELT